ncbi:hypothetical protein ATANTOWER_008644, partial [Ataeniobius toweri]|nr:hypothetical protein [Ataeniobius toweri]
MAVLESAAAVAVPTAGPSRNNEDPQPSLYLTTSIEIFMQDQSPAHALCSLLAMCWFWSSSSEAEEEDLNLGSALLSLGCLIKDKLACLADNVSACLSCQRSSKQAGRQAAQERLFAGSEDPAARSNSMEAAVQTSLHGDQDAGGAGVALHHSVSLYSVRDMQSVLTFWEVHLWSDHAIMSQLMSRWLINGSLDCLWTPGEFVVGWQLTPVPELNDSGCNMLLASCECMRFDARSVRTEGLLIHVCCCTRFARSVDTVCTIYNSYQEGSAAGGVMDDLKETQGGESGSGPDREGVLLRPCPKHMSVTERLRKVIQELVDTEKSYVKDLGCLFDIYLKPLQSETFLTQDEMESLFGSLPEMLDFQRVFLQTLEERIPSKPDLSTLETPSQFKKLLFSLGGSFLYYADHFKLYCGFCANHIKVQQVLKKAKTDQAFKEFLDAKNPTKQHSSTLESYLIKPVQRVLKYPLLLRELVSLTDTDSEEHYHLTEALKAMEKVASHINEMQKIYEDFGSVFDQLVAEQTGHDKEVTEISMGEFLMHSSVVWLNPHPSLGRMRKDPEMTVFVFKKAVILVYRENYKLKKKMINPRSGLCHGDLDPFKFRWLIPLSALQVRLGNTAGTGTDSSCIWELIHSKSEVEGRPETVFQLCS